jgi:hypothetical protein
MQAGNQQQQKQSAEKKQTARIFDDSAYVCGRYKCTIVIDSPTHAIEISVGRYGTEVKREFSLVINGKQVTLNETANNYGSLSKDQWDECFLPLANLFKGSFNGKKTVLKGYWHHQSGHTSSHFVYDKV